MLSSFSVKVRRPTRKPVIEKPSDTTTEITITRRAFLRAVIAAVVVIPIIYLGLNRLFPTQEVQIRLLRLHYYLHSLDPSQLVKNPFAITYEEIKTMPSVEEYARLQCVSNKIGTLE